MARSALAVCLVALALTGVATGASILDFQEQINSLTAQVVAAQDPSLISTDLVPQFQVLSNTLTSGAGALSEFATNGAVAIAKLDTFAETALQQIAGIQASTLNAAILSTVRDSLCGLVKQIHDYAASLGVPVAANTPASCFGTPAPVLLWQQQLTNANAALVGIENGLSGANLKAVQDLTKTIQDAIAGAGQYATNPTLGFNDVTNAITKATIQIQQLLPKLKAVGKSTVLDTVNGVLSTVKSSVSDFATAAGVTGLTNGLVSAVNGLTSGLKIAEADTTTTEAPAPAPARRLLSA